jgi:hypothetical protein
MDGNSKAWPATRPMCVLTAAVTPSLAAGTAFAYKTVIPTRSGRVHRWLPTRVAV